MSSRGSVVNGGVRRIVMALVGTVTAVVLLFGYRTSSSSTPTSTSVIAPGGTSSSTSGSAGSSVPGGSTSSGSSSPDSSSSASGSSDSSSSGSGSTDSGASGSTTYTGDAVGTRWGDVQVQITVANGVITAVNAVEVPSGNQRDVEINNRAVPVLADEALQAQSADIDTVSGATVTSDGYLASLQSAIDQAGL